MLTGKSKREEQVSTSRETYLTRTEVRGYLAALEKKYGFSSVSFLLPNFRERVLEDDAFKWEAYIDHYEELRRADEETHKAYLSKVSRAALPESSHCAEVMLAA